MKTKALIGATVVLALALVVVAFLLAGMPAEEVTVEQEHETTVIVAGDASANTGSINTVVIEGYNFMPTDLTINVGDTVEWVNKDDVHYSIDFTGGEFVAELPDGAIISHTFTEAGDYYYVSQFHREDRDMDDEVEDPEMTHVLQGVIFVR